MEWLPEKSKMFGKMLKMFYDREDEMKIAISTDGDFVSPHFGRCPNFTIVEVDNSKIISREVIANPGHHPGFLPEFFDNMGVNCIIAGGAGTRAQALFAEKQIQVIVGVSGRVDDVLEKLLKGELKGGESLCSHDAGKGHGMEKSECEHHGK